MTKPSSRVRSRRARGPTFPGGLAIGGNGRQRAGDGPVTLPRDNRGVPRTEPAAVLVLRVWREGEDSNGLRARFMYPEASGARHPRGRGTVDDVCGAVRDWIVNHVARRHPGDATVTAERRPVLTQVAKNSAA